MIAPFLLLTMLPLCGATQDARTTDGLALRLNDRGTVTSLRLDNRELLRPGETGGIFLADVATIPSLEPQVHANSSFEKLVDGKPVGWTFGPEWSVDTTAPHSGRTCMKLTMPGPERKSSSDLYFDLAVKPNTPYRVAIWLRNQGLAPDVWIELMDAQGRHNANYPQLCLSNGRPNSDWFKVGQDFVTPPFCRKLRVRTGVWEQGAGTSWIDDFSLVSLEDDYLTPQRQVVGKPSDIDVATRYESGGDHLRVHCDLRDTTGRDRAVTVSFRLPLAARGWTWHDDIHTSQRLEPGVIYGAARVSGDRRLIGVYPFAALGDDRSALALAVRMDQPRAFRLGYDDRLGLFATYEFGLTQAASKFPGRASFDLVLYRTDPAWGFRSAAQRYYDLFPDFFTKRLTPEAGAGWQASEAEVSNSAFIFPDLSVFAPHEALEPYRRELTKLFSYTECTGFWGWWLGVSSPPKQPNRDDAMALVRKLADGATGTPDQQKVARCILDSGIYGRDGKPYLWDAYMPDWGGFNYACNPDPEVEGEFGKLSRFSATEEWEVGYVKAFGVDGMYFDGGGSDIDNYRVAHFRWADYPLVFDHLTKRPVLPQDWSLNKAMRAISDDIHARGKLTMSNYTCTDGPTDIFNARYIDVIGNEMLYTWTADPKLSLQRTLAHQKTVTMSWQEAKNDWPAARVEAEMKQAMFYGTFYYLSRMNREAFDRWNLLTARLAEAGWEPLTYARSSVAAVLVERFGDMKSGSLHFTLRNDTDADRDISLSLDRAKLGLPAEGGPGLYQYTDAAHWQSASAAHVKVPAHDTVVLRLCDAAGLAADQLFGADSEVLRAENYRKALVAAGAKVDASDLPALAERVRNLGSAPDSAALESVRRDLAAVTIPTPSGTEAPLAARMGYHLLRAAAQLARAAAPLAR